MKDLEFYEINPSLNFSSKIYQKNKKVTFALINDIALFDEEWILTTLSKINYEKIKNVEIVLIDCFHQFKKKFIPTESLLDKYPSLRIFYLKEENNSITDVLNTFIKNEKSDIVVFISRIFELKKNNLDFSFLIDYFKKENSFINVFENISTKGEIISNVFKKDKNNNLVLYPYQNNTKTICINGLFFAIDKSKFISLKGLKKLENLTCSFIDLILRGELKTYETITDQRLSATLSFEPNFNEKSFKEGWKEIINKSYS